MNRPDRGLKHLCPECATKYYDLRKAVVACPKCGATPLAAELPKAAPTARRTGHPTFGAFRAGRSWDRQLNRRTPGRIVGETRP
jgi:hypothetical protein